MKTKTPYMDHLEETWRGFHDEDLEQMNEQAMTEKKCAFCGQPLFILDGDGQNRRLFGMHDEQGCEIESLRQQLRDARYIIDRYKEQAGVAECASGHRYLKNWSDFCPLCKIDALSSGGQNWLSST